VRKTDWSKEKENSRHIKERAKEKKTPKPHHIIEAKKKKANFKKKKKKRGAKQVGRRDTGPEYNGAQRSRV